MTNKIRSHVYGGGRTEGSPLTPKVLTKQEFGRRLYSEMISRGWSQSEFARQADLPRDRISTYVRGRVMPTPEALEKVAKALGVEADDLLPNYSVEAIEADEPAMEMKVSPGAPGVSWLRVNRLVSTSVAVKILAMLEADNVNDRSRGRVEAPLSSVES